MLRFFVCPFSQKQKGVEEKTMSENVAPQIKYDVFVNFRGGDIRDGFLSHLNEAFDMNNINAIVDDKLERGEEIWQSLVEAIEGSSISFIIFSQDYASSQWCLKELVTILECREKYGQIVIPVFYHLEPRHVRHQSGSYKNAFAEHERKHKSKQVQVWRRALNKAADLSGIESSKFRNDAELVKEIVNLVLKRLVKTSVISKGLIGIDEEIKTAESWIRKEQTQTRLIGIWGRGVDKTIFAEEVFNKLQSGCYILAHETEESNKQGIITLKEKCFSRLLAHDLKIYTPNSFPKDILRKIGCVKVLIILDDLNDLSRIENLLETLDNFGFGSKVIVTRDEQVLKANKVDKTYQLKELSSDKALEVLFERCCESNKI